MRGTVTPGDNLPCRPTRASETLCVELSYVFEHFCSSFAVVGSH